MSASIVLKLQLKNPNKIQCSYKLEKKKEEEDNKTTEQQNDDNGLFSLKIKFLLCEWHYFHTKMQFTYRLSVDMLNITTGTVAERI